MHKYQSPKIKINFHQEKFIQNSWLNPGSVPWYRFIIKWTGGSPTHPLSGFLANHPVVFCGISIKEIKTNQNQSKSNLKSFTGTDQNSFVMICDCDACGCLSVSSALRLSSSAGVRGTFRWCRSPAHPSGGASNWRVAWAAERPPRHHRAPPPPLAAPPGPSDGSMGRRQPQPSLLGVFTVCSYSSSGSTAQPPQWQARGPPGLAPVRQGALPPLVGVHRLRGEEPAGLLHQIQDLQVSQEEEEHLVCPASSLLPYVNVTTIIILYNLSSITFFVGSTRCFGEKYL